MFSLIPKITKSRFVVFCVLLLFGLSLYSFILGAQFKMIDDYASILFNKDIRSFSSLKSIFTQSFFGLDSYYRPLVHLSFMVEYHFFKLNFFYYNLTNIILHVLMSFGVFQLIAKIFKDKNYGFIIAFLYVIHPIHWETVGNIPGRSNILCSLLMLYSFYLFILAENSKRGSIRWYVPSVVIFALSLFAKESAMVMPGILMAYLYFFRKDTGNSPASIFTLTLPYILLIIAIFAIRKMLGITALFNIPSIDYYVRGILTFLFSCFEHIQLMVLPIEMYYDRSFIIFENFKQPLLWVTAGVWSVFAVWLSRNWRKLDNRYKFFLVWIALNFFTVSQIVPVKISKNSITAADHFLYLPAIGMLIFMVYFFQKLADWLVKNQHLRPRMIKVFAIVYVCFLCVTTVKQNYYAKDQISMLKHSVARNSYNPRIVMALAVAYTSLEEYEMAAKHFQMILDSNPRDEKAKVGLGVTYVNLGRYWDAIKQFDRIWPEGRYGDMAINNRMRALEELEARYLNDLLSDASNVDLHYSLGVVYTMQDEFQQGVDQFLKALKINPAHLNAQFNLAVSYINLEQKDEAVALYLKVIKHPDIEQALLNKAYNDLSSIYLEKGDQKQSDYYRGLIK